MSNKTWVNHFIKSYIMVLLQMEVFLIFMLLFIPSDGRIFSPEIVRDIRSFVEASMKCHHIPGMTLSVVKGIHFMLNVLRV